MYQKIQPLFLLCETPLHAGTGSELGVVDLPIQRERHTFYPKLESSSLKGALREDFEQNQRLIKIGEKSFKVNEKVHPNTRKAEAGSPLALAFGPEGDDSVNTHAGALGFTDARLLLFPVKSMRGIFAWVTCPAVLHRFQRDMWLVYGEENFSICNIPEKKDLRTENGNFAYYFADCQAEIPSKDAAILEEYTFFLASSGKDKVKVKTGKKDNDCTTLLGEYLSEILELKNDFLSEKLKSDILIIDNDDFRDFVEMSTEVITRIKIDNEKGTVEKGGLFTEEYLPTDSLMYSLAMSAPVFQVEEKRKHCLLQTAEDVMSYFEEGLKSRVIQVGANATLGKGLLQTKLLTSKTPDDYEQQS